MYSKILKGLAANKISLDSLGEYKNESLKYASSITSNKRTLEEIESFLKVCLEYYVFSESGDTLIPDIIYDDCMNIYLANGGKKFFCTNVTESKKWEIKQHKVPGLVGTLNKIYTEEEAEIYFDKFNQNARFYLAPKYDGVSCSIEVRNGKIVTALTRYDGISGQDISRLVVNAKQYTPLNRDGYYKCEIVISQKDFMAIQEYKEYANRRSATSGIINTPSNIQYGEYLTILPLLYYDGDKIDYCAPGRIPTTYYNLEYMMEDIYRLLEDIRSNSFPFRVDGVVIYPELSGLLVNELDMLEESIAYKCNTAEAKTIIEYAYPSVGRTGKVMPMVKVVPVEVNEIIVTDVSLGSHEKMLSMDLVEHDEVIVFSAGDVIPQIKLPRMRTNFANNDNLKMPKICPYCGERFERINNEYYCTNPDCVRVAAGRITNFFTKLGLEGFSDKTFEAIYLKLDLARFSDYLNLTVEQALCIDGFEEVSANKLVEAINKVRSTPISISKFVGALGIENISEKKCRQIFDAISFKEMLNANDRELDEIQWLLRGAEGVGPKTATTFVDFFKDYQSDIKELSTMMNLQRDIKYRGNVVFTGFRDSKLEYKLNEIDFEVSDTISSNTVAVIAASLTGTSSKIAKAKKKGIPLYSYSEADDLIEYLR